MPFFKRKCFLDFGNLVHVDPDGLFRYNVQLPGYLRDLRSTQGELVGLVFSSGPFGDPELREALVRDMRQVSKVTDLEIFVLLEEDAQGSLWHIRRDLGIDFRQCLLYVDTEGGGRLESLAQEVRMHTVRFFDKRYGKPPCVE